MGDAMRAKRYADEGLQLAERFGSDRNIVYALLACGNASLLGLRWKEGVGYLERAQELLIATGAGGEWSTMIDAHLAVCLAELGEHDRSLELARRAAELAPTDMFRSQGFMSARALRMGGGLEVLDELEALIAQTWAIQQRLDAKGWMPLLLMERPD